MYAKLIALALLGSVLSAPLIKRIVVTPPIYNPAGGEIYSVGSLQTVEWKTNNIPNEASNYTGTIYLGYSDGHSLDEHLDIEHPLACDFKLTDGAVDVTIPKVPTRNDYFFVLVGDSGNKSPSFSIVD